jgi:hypothetical protein
VGIRGHGDFQNDRDRLRPLPDCRSRNRRLCEAGPNFRIGVIAASR